MTLAVWPDLCGSQGDGPTQIWMNLAFRQNCIHSKIAFILKCGVLYSTGTWNPQVKLVWLPMSPCGWALHRSGVSITTWSPVLPASPMAVALATSPLHPTLVMKKDESRVFQEEKRMCSSQPYHLIISDNTIHIFWIHFQILSSYETPIGWTPLECFLSS